MTEHGGEERELLKPLKVMVKIIEELYPSENGGYQHSEEYRAVHAALRDAREAIKRAESHPLPDATDADGVPEAIRYLLLSLDAPDESRPTRGFFNAAVTEAFYRGNAALQVAAPVEESQRTYADGIRDAARIASHFTAGPNARIHPDISWEQMNETAKMIAHTTAQQISWAIEESVSSPIEEAGTR